MSTSLEKASRQILEHKPLFFDTETTGVNDVAEIVEVGIVDSAGELVFESLVRPSRPISPDAAAVHGISDEVVQGAPTWDEVFPEIKQLFQGKHVGIFNSGFDLRMMRQSHEQCGLAWKKVGGKAFCVMKMYTKWWGARRGIRNPRWQSLQKAGQQCGIELPNSHRATDDARLTSAVFRHMAGVEVSK